MRTRATVALPSRQVDVDVVLPSGSYDVTWVRPETGETAASERISHAGGTRTLRSPAFTTDVALKIVRGG